ncbi:MAG: nuclear transport factor 2 family protein [Pacificimonas sp.]|jgi:ketosteroid isomerase-like protein|nr:nuclear transport factor 2 family protein [Pacificimonas sp.]
MTIRTAFHAALLITSPARAEGVDTVEAGLELLRAAALSGDTEAAAAVFPDDLVLVSQSGRVYGRAAALADLGNGFEAWDNEDLVVRIDEDSPAGTAIVTFVNRRTRTGMDAAAFRVTQVWQRPDGDGWMLAVQASARLRE